VPRWAGGPREPGCERGPAEPSGPKSRVPAASHSAAGCSPRGTARLPPAPPEPLPRGAAASAAAALAGSGALSC